MASIWLIVDIISSVLLIALTAAQLLRDWKFHDLRTKEHHRITKGILISEDKQHYVAMLPTPIHSGTIMQLGELIVTNSLDRFKNVGLKFSATAEGGYSKTALFSLALQK